MLERAGIKRPPDLLVAATGDDEDNIIICQLAREKYGIDNVIARINDPRNQPYFDLLGISPTVSATGAILGLIEHEVPDHGLIHLLELRKENLEIVELTIDEHAASKGKRVGGLKLPEGARVISVVRNGTAEIPDENTQLQPGDQVLAILEPGKEDELRRALPEPTSVERRYGVRVRRPAPPILLAWFAALAGLVSIVSALTPEMAEPRRPGAGRSCRRACRAPRGHSCSRSGSG